MIDLVELGPGVYASTKAITCWGEDEISFIKKVALETPRLRARICAHLTGEDLLHEMLIAISCKSYIHPHRHVIKSESFHVVEGIVDIIVLDEWGEISEIVELGPPGSGRPFYYRMSESKFHTLRIHSNILVVHEVTNGPLEANGTVMAEFAPNEANKTEVAIYEKLLSKKIQIYRQGKLI